MHPDIKDLQTAIEGLIKEELYSLAAHVSRTLADKLDAEGQKKYRAKVA